MATTYTLVQLYSPENAPQLNGEICGLTLPEALSFADTPIAYYIHREDAVPGKYGTVVGTTGQGLTTWRLFRQWNRYGRVSAA